MLYRQKLGAFVESRRKDLGLTLRAMTERLGYMRDATAMVTSVERGTRNVPEDMVSNWIVALELDKQESDLFCLYVLLAKTKTLTLASHFSSLERELNDGSRSLSVQRGVVSELVQREHDAKELELKTEAVAKLRAENEALKSQIKKLRSFRRKLATIRASIKELNSAMDDIDVLIIHTNKPRKAKAKAKQSAKQPAKPKEE